ncbi:hypothetical protein BDR03DRAFT_1096313 [Suillus americanus]|nr:hypothetical protein BDR03DRAFT_1096313 [Suillus americanus]
MRDRQNLATKNFHLPRTKSAPEGEGVHWAKQAGLSDPEEAFLNHLRINEPPTNFALFAYRHKDNTHRPLTKTTFLSRLASATRAAGREPLQGHGIRIGSTLEYLLRNIPFDVVKVKGRWASDAFLAYLRKHAQIMAPYMQAVPTLHDEFLRCTIPPISSSLYGRNSNLDNPLDASVFACLTTIFYATARVGEFTVPRLNAFDPKLHVSLDCVKDMRDRQNLTTKNFHLPRTKSAPEGEGVHWAKQAGLSDPEEAFLNHLRINEPPTNFALFAYRHKDNTHRPLTKTKFLSRLASATRAAGREPLQGHGIRIGSTLEYLLRNIPFDVVKVKGRWASDTFLAYLRKHAQIMAPYMQAVPTLHDEFLRCTIPPVR